MSSAYPILLWLLWECVLNLIIIINSEVWLIPLYRVRSWNNGMRCMLYYVLRKIQLQDIDLKCRWNLEISIPFENLLLYKYPVTYPLPQLQYIPRNMHTVFALLCFVVVIHWLIFPYPSGLLHWHCGNLTIAPVPAKQPWWIWINTSCEFSMNDCITTTKQSTTKPCAYFLGYTVGLKTRVITPSGILRLTHYFLLSMIV